MRLDREAGINISGVLLAKAAISSKLVTDGTPSSGYVIGLTSFVESGAILV